MVPAADEAVLDAIDEGVLDEDLKEEPEFDILSCGPAKISRGHEHIAHIHTHMHTNTLSG